MKLIKGNLAHENAFPHTRLEADLILLLVAALWGSAFAAQRAAAAQGEVLFFNGVRYLLGASLILPILIRQRLDYRNLPLKAWLGGGLAGLAMFLAVAFQQYGLQYTTAANAGFITGLYVMMIPFLLAIFYRKPPRLMIWISSLMATIGMFLLSTEGGLAISLGDRWVLLGALMWAFHVLIIDRITHKLSLPFLAVTQASVCGGLSLLSGIWFERATLSSLNGIWWAVIWTAVASIALGFSLQPLGQRVAPPADAAILLSMESVFAALFGWLILGEGLTSIQLLGCVLMFLALVLAQISFQPKVAVD
ncbi:MAG: Permease of the drug/metabolite transporter (DMT) superfamily [Anaerolineae bacterium]|jgi:drug/metabolite transporter (DMT)-like permease|nr:MAG: Permease of the drug/metabolite transporter (DMT) superfamily [Anaerolineae bacterium]